MDADALRQQRASIRRDTEVWLLDLMVAAGAGAVLAPDQHLRVLQARKAIEILSCQLVDQALT
jgi:hypothetical protein